MSKWQSSLKPTHNESDSLSQLECEPHKDKEYVAGLNEYKLCIFPSYLLLCLTHPKLTVFVG